MVVVDVIVPIQGRMNRRSVLVALYGRNNSFLVMTTRIFTETAVSSRESVWAARVAKMKRPIERSRSVNLLWTHASERGGGQAWHRAKDSKRVEGELKALQSHYSTTGRTVCNWSCREQSAQFEDELCQNITKRTRLARKITRRISR